MNENYTAITIGNVDTALSEILIAQLAAIAFDGFEQEPDKLKAFILTDKFDMALLDKTIAGYKIAYSMENIAARNWNEEWEKNFDPVIVDDFAAVRAHFHQPETGVLHDIIITPKMSFGTGHHATTYLVMQEMRNINFNGKTVLDFGTGTGILAILAEKMQARSILAIDNDAWSIANAEENLAANKSMAIQVLQADRPPQTVHFDIILANINKHIILGCFPALVNILHKPGLLILSGLLKEDEADILTNAANLHIEHQHTTYNNNWICIKFSY